MSLSVCLLTRNEASTVARAVRSVLGVADEVLVADTGSTDGTAGAAAAAGARVSQFDWADDFAAGRNHLLARAAGDWFFWLDAKEELAPESRDALRRSLTRDDAFGLFVTVRRLGADGRPASADTADLRLLRRRPGLRFVGRLHPRIEPAVVDAVRREGLAAAPCDVVLLHHADRGRPDESKLRWTARLLELELRDRPGQLHYLIEQGRTLLLLDDPAGHAAMRDAAEQVARGRHDDRPPGAKVQVLLQYLLTCQPAAVAAAPGPPLPLPLTRDDARTLSLRWFPVSPGLLSVIAEERFRADDYEGAADLLRRLVQLGRTGTYDRSQSFPPELVGEQALLNLGACYLQLKRPAEAEACLLQLAASPTYGADAARQLALVGAMRSTP